MPSSEARPYLARALAVGALALVLGACSFRAGYDEVTLTCELATECTSGLCLNGLCAPDLADAALVEDPDADTTDADVPDGGVDLPDADPAAPDAGINPPPPVPCGSMFLLQDDFNDGARDSIWIPFTSGGSSTAETGGKLALRLTSGSSSNAEASYRSKASYDLRSSSLAVTAEKVSGQITALEIRDFGERGALIGVEGDLLVAMTVTATGESTRASTVYNADAHRHWRLREASGTLFWETSADRATWQTLHSEALPMSGTYGFAELLMTGQRATASEALFEDLNLPVTASPGFCKASSIKDTFDDGALSLSYNNWVGTSGCSGREANGQIELTFSGSGESWCGVETSQLLDFRNDAVFVEAIPSTHSQMESFFEVITFDRDKIETLKIDDVVYMAILRNDSLVFSASTVWNATSMRYWRLRESNGTVFWDFSANGTSWSTRVSANTTIDVSAVVIDMAAGHQSPGPGSTQTARYDRLNQLSSGI